MKFIYRLILRRPFFRGQYRLFFYLFNRNRLQLSTPILTQPLKGNFKLTCDTKTLIGAQIHFLGDYESYIKAAFEQHIHPGNTVLDVGANIGFHTLFFSELVGNQGKVLAFEPVKYNFEKLKDNITLNGYSNITLYQLALGNSNETFSIKARQDDSNPGAFNLFEKGDLEIKCVIGDDIIKEKIDFIKLDVEGYELYAFQGLHKVIETNKPKIVFEYDRNYQLRTHESSTAIFDFLVQFNYQFHEIKHEGLVPIEDYTALVAGDVLALPQ